MGILLKLSPAPAQRRNSNDEWTASMSRKLKTFVTSLGFFDLAVAAPSMKAALDAWGFRHNAFQQGFASETGDAQIIKAAMAQPGIVLRRPVGTDQPFGEDAELPQGFS